MPRSARHVALMMFGALLLGGCSSPTAPAHAPLSPLPGGTPQLPGDVLSGTVYDTVWRPLEGVRIEVLNGPDAGIAVTSSVNGAFSLRGAIDANTSVRATRPGYVATTRQVSVYNGSFSAWMYLETDGPQLQIAGNYTLSIAAAASCAGLLPEALRQRTYDAAIVVDPSYPTSEFLLTIAGASAQNGLVPAWVGVAGDYLAMWITDGGQIFEPLDDDGYLLIDGTVGASAGTVSPSTLSMNLQGEIQYCPTKGAGFPFRCASPRAVRCSAASHRLTLERK